jgi:hypothetical protein
MRNEEVLINSELYKDGETVSRRNRKTDLDQIIVTLLDEIGDIQRSDKSTSAKTMGYRRAADKVLTALYGKRKQKSGAALSLDGASKALTKVRNAVTATGAKHHAFDKSIQALKNKYPLVEYMLCELEGMPVKQTRETWHGLREKLKQVTRLEKKVANITPDLKTYASAINQLAKEFPAWESELLALKTIKTSERQDAIDRLHAIFETTRSFYPDLEKLKIDHEVMRHLKKDSFSSDSKREESTHNLIAKKTGAIGIDYTKLMQVLDLLMSPAASHRWEAAATAVAIATGRRAIEVLVQGEFEKIDNHRLKFIGQAKKREGITDDEMEIYCLADANLVLKTISRLRSFSNIIALDSLEADRHYKKNELISSRTAGPLNSFIRDLFDSFQITTEHRFKDDWLFKDTRAIYAKTAFELFFKEDKRWQKKDENMFYQELLGHHDGEAQKHYMQFKIINAGAKWEPVIDDSPDRRLKAMIAMRENEWISARANRLALHDYVIEEIKKNPWVTFKIADLRKDSNGGSRNFKMVKEYLEIVEDAIKVDWSIDAILDSKSTVNTAEVKKAKPAKPEVEAEEPKQAPVAKPKFKVPYQDEGGNLIVEFSLGDDSYIEKVADATNRMQAYQQAWDQYQAKAHLPKEPPEPIVTKQNGTWYSRIIIKGQVLCETWTGSKKASRESSLRMYKVIIG